MSAATAQTKAEFWTSTVVAQVASAIAERLPVPEALVPSEPVTGQTPPWPQAAAAAVLARLSGVTDAELVIVIDSELVDFLKNSPLGALELLPALQPAVAAAAALVGASAGPLQTVPVDVPEAKVGTSTPISVSLVANGVHHATVWVRGIDRAAQRASSTAATPRASLEMLRDVEMEVTVEIGRTRMTVRELLELTPGQVVELDRAAGSPADLLVNGTLLARGEIVVVDEDFGIRITEIVSSVPAGSPEGHA